MSHVKQGSTDSQLQENIKRDPYYYWTFYRMMELQISIIIIISKYMVINGWVKIKVPEWLKIH